MRVCRSAAVLAGTMLLWAAPATSAATAPRTIPALREWRAAPGSFELRGSSSILFEGRAGRPLRSEATLLARDLERLTGRRTPVLSSDTAAPEPGDIELRLGSPDRRLGREGYRLDVGTVLRIEARAVAGAFYGTRTVLQLLRRGGAIPAGRARDWPRYPERGLMIDNGRRYFSPAWIKRRIRELAYLKLNQLHLHFSDNEGFRVESESHPEIVSRPYLTKRQVEAIVQLGRRHHVRVIPEIDMPGHLRAALAAHPELQLADAAGARRQARARYGAGATGADAYLGFVNWIDRLVRRRGRTLRVWHDGLSGGRRVRPHRGVVVEWWADHAGPSPRALLARGHRILNAGWFPTYYVVGPLGAVRPSMRVAYESWSVNLFGGLALNSPTPSNPFQITPAGTRRNLGSELHVWNDDPDGESAAATARGIAPRLRVLAQKTWDTQPPARSYAGFLRIARTIGNAPR